MENQTLRQILSEIPNPWYREPDRFNPNGSFNDSVIESIVDWIDDSPESLKDFCHSDWINLAEPYTRDLINRWDSDRNDLIKWADDYCDQTGIDIHEALADSFDPDNYTAGFVNLAMSWAAVAMMNIVFPEYR